MPRSHDRDSFFKFYSMETAKKVIASKKLLWSSPLLFNDPFDTQSSLSAPIDEEVFVDRFHAALMAIVFDDELPDYVDRGARLHQVALGLREVRARLPRREVELDLRQGALEMARNFPESLRQFSESIVAHMTHSRVFCLSEDVNNVVMWSHYAEQHQGVGFKFRVLDDIDHPFRIAKAIEYVHEYPMLGTTEEVADHFSRRRKIDISSLVWRIVFSKHRDWAYEREWRCYFPLLDPTPDTKVMLMDQDPRLFEAVYLGCRTEAGPADTLVALCREALPDTEIYQARKSREAFALEFDRLA